MARYLLSPALWVARGLYDYRSMSPRLAVLTMEACVPFSSRIADEETADHIASLGLERPKVSQMPLLMRPGDWALVVRVQPRIPRQRAGGAVQTGTIWEYGALGLK